MYYKWFTEYLKHIGGQPVPSLLAMKRAKEMAEEWRWWVPVGGLQHVRRYRAYKDVKAIETITGRES